MKQDGRANLLSDEKEQRLLGEGFVFDTSTPTFKFFNSGVRRLKDDWDHRFQELKEFINTHGSMDSVPRRANPQWPLVGWVYKQRVQYRRSVRGEPNRLTEERLAQLRSVNFDFSFARSISRPVPESAAKITSKAQEL
jgi:Helicase associated domain